MQAMLPQLNCVEILRVDESAWNERTCNGGLLQTDNPGGGGCGISGYSGVSPAFGAAELTSATLLAALLAYRRRRGAYQEKRSNDV